VGEVENGEAGVLGVVGGKIEEGIVGVEAS